jgi:hypothetical protein
MCLPVRARDGSKDRAIVGYAAMATRAAMVYVVAATATEWSHR